MPPFCAQYTAASLEKAMRETAEHMMQSVGEVLAKFGGARRLPV